MRLKRSSQDRDLARCPRHPLRRDVLRQNHRQPHLLPRPREGGCCRPNYGDRDLKEARKNNKYELVDTWVMHGKWPENEFIMRQERNGELLCSGRRKCAYSLWRYISISPHTFT